MCILSLEELKTIMLWPSKYHDIFFQVDNFIHADMHPGNILVRVTQSKSSRKRLFKSKPHVIFLDVGMTAELSKSDQVNLLGFFKAVARRDGRTAAECALRLSKQQNCPNPKAFIKVIYYSYYYFALEFLIGMIGIWLHNVNCLNKPTEFMYHVAI